MDDVSVQPVIAPMQQVQVSLPDEAAAPAMEDGAGSKIYLCDGYTVTVQTFSGGDLDKTLQQATGFSRESLTLLETGHDGVTRYDCAWSTMGEGGNQVCRGVVLDDGRAHYVVCVMAPESEAGAFRETWQNILSSVTLVSTD